MDINIKNLFSIKQKLIDGDLSDLAEIKQLVFKVEQTDDLEKYFVPHEGIEADIQYEISNRIGKIKKSKLKDRDKKTYSGEDIPFYYVLNPQKRGALGVKVPFDDKIRLFVSGPLNGCSVAIVKKQNTLLFIHAGADMSCSGQVDPSGVNMDLYKLVLNHENSIVSDTEKVITDKALADKLLNLQYTGFIFHPANESKIIDYNNITLHDYNGSEKSYIYAVTKGSSCKILLTDTETGKAEQYYIN